MAILVEAQEVFTLVVTLAALDTNGKLTFRQKEFEIAPSVLVYDDAVAAAVAMMTDLDATNEADIYDYSVRGKHRWDGTAVTVVGNLWKEAVLSLAPLDGSEKITHTIYSPDDTLAPSGGGVNTGDTDLAAYLDNFESGADLTLSDGEFIATTNQIASARIRRVASKDN